MIIKSSEKKEKNNVGLIIGVSAEEFDSAIGEAYRKNRNSISVPGFRKGKAPRKIIERMYGPSIFHSDAFDALVPSVVRFIADESGLDIVGFPRATDVKVDDETGTVEFMFDASVYPEVTIGEYKGLSAVRPQVPVPDSEIDGEIAGVRLRNARIEKADRPACVGDTAVIDYEGFIDGEPFEGGKGENYELELGSDSFIAGFEDKINGMVAGEERDLDLMFPVDYAEPLAGKDVIFKVKLHEVREKILPDPDDEFAKDVSEFDTFDEYKDSIRQRLSKLKQVEADAAFESALLEKIVESMEADVPDVMIEEQMDHAMNNFARQISAYGMDPDAYLQMMGTTPGAFREKSRESSARQVRVTLALEKIAELEGVEVSDEDIENEYIEAAGEAGMEVDKLKESVSLDAVKSEIKLKRAVRIVRESAIVLDPPPEDEETGTEEGPEENPEESPEDAKAAEKPKTAKKTAAKKTAVKKPKPGAEEITAAETEAEAEA